MVSVGMSRLAALKKSSADTATVYLQTSHCQQVHGSGDLSAPLEAVGYYVHFVNPSTSQLNGWYYFRDP